MDISRPAIAVEKRTARWGSAVIVHQ